MPSIAFFALPHCPESFILFGHFYKVGKPLLEIGGTLSDFFDVADANLPVCFQKLPKVFPVEAAAFNALIMSVEIPNK